MNTTRKSYPSDASDAEWTFLLPYLTLMRSDAPQRSHDLRDGLGDGLLSVDVAPSSKDNACMALHH
jgi:hypothetical protein